MEVVQNIWKLLNETPFEVMLASEHDVPRNMDCAGAIRRNILRYVVKPGGILTKQYNNISDLYETIEQKIAESGNEAERIRKARNLIDKHPLIETIDYLDRRFNADNSLIEYFASLSQSEMQKAVSVHLGGRVQTLFEEPKGEDFGYFLSVGYLLGFIHDINPKSAKKEIKNSIQTRIIKPMLDSILGNGNPIENVNRVEHYYKLLHYHS